MRLRIGAWAGRRASLMVAVGATAGLVPASAVAAADEVPGGEPIQVVYVPPAGCPSMPALLAMLRASTSHFRLAADGEAVRSFSVEALDCEPGRPGPGVQCRARLTIQDPARGVAVREVPGDTCADVVAAATFIAALAIDPEAAPVSKVSETVEPAAAQSAVPAVPPASDAVAPAAPMAKVVEREPPPRRAELRGLVALRAGGVTATAPTVAPYARIAVELSFGRRDSLFVPSVALSVARALTRTVTTSAGDAHLTWTTGRVELCPVHLPPRAETVVGVELCPFFEGGLLAGTASNTTERKTADRAWLVVGGLARADLTLGGPWSLELEASAGAPILRYRFYFSPDVDAYRMPAASFSFGAGAAVRFR